MINTGKIIFGIMVSGVFTSAATATAFSFIRVGGNGFMDFDSVGLHVIIGLVYGGVIGLVAGAIISGFDLNPFSAMCFELIYSLIIGIALLMIMSGARWSEEVRVAYYVSILVNILNGAVVSIITSSSLFFK